MSTKHHMGDEKPTAKRVLLEEVYRQLGCPDDSGKEETSPIPDVWDWKNGPPVGMFPGRRSGAA